MCRVPSGLCLTFQFCIVEQCVDGLTCQFKVIAVELARSVFMLFHL